MNIFPSKNLNIYTTTVTAVIPGGVDFVLAKPFSGDITITIPTAVGKKGAMIQVCKSPESNDIASAVKIVAENSEYLGFRQTIWLNALNDAITFLSNGANWLILSQYIQDVHYNANGATTAGTTLQYKDMCSVTLTMPGIYDIFASGYFSYGGATTGNNGMAISANTGNDQSDHVQGDNEIIIPAVALNAGNFGMSLKPWRQSFSAASKTFYFKAAMTYSSGTPNISGYVYAKRIGFWAS